MEKSEFHKIRTSAYRFLAYRPRTEYELVTHLRRLGGASEVISRVIQGLKDYKMVDDEKFAQDWVSHRNSIKPMGRLGLSRELLHKGVSPDIIEQVLSKMGEEEEFKLALTLAEKRQLRYKHNVTLLKIAAFLQRRGFAFDTISRVMRYLEGVKAG